jgi:hypothetical protein
MDSDGDSQRGRYVRTFIVHGALAVVAIAALIASMLP